MKLLVSDPRQDLILQEFVDQGKWKNALDQCEKRIKKLKKGNDHRLQLNYLMIELKSQLLQGTLSQDDLVKAVSSRSAVLEYLDVCDDLEFIEHIEDAFDHVGGELWKRASKARRNDEDFFQAWFDLKFRKEEFREAAEACMHWRVNFPQKGSELTMRMAMCYHLSSQNARHGAVETEKVREQRDRDAKMALGLLRQAAKGTPAKTTKDIALGSSFDLELLVDVFSLQGLASEAITILDDPDKGLLSPLGCWELVQVKVRLLYTEKRWPELFKFGMEVLEDALEGLVSGSQGKNWKFGEAGDDILLYDAVVAASSNMQEPARTDEAVNIFHKLADALSLNARLAMVKLGGACSTSSTCLKSATEFFGHYKYKSLAVSVIPYVPLSQRTAFLRYTSKLQETDSIDRQSGGAILQLNCLRAKYELGLDIKEEISTFEQQSYVSNLQGLVLECIWTYAAANAAEPARPAPDNSIADPALTIAARALVVIASLGDLSALHHARLLLQCLLSNSKYNYEASILLVRVYLSQGAIRSALPLYKRLEIKNLQQINEAGVFFGGLSTSFRRLLPKGAVSPAKMLDSAIAWTAKRKSSIRAQSVSCVDSNDWTGACRAVAFASDWVRSPGYITVVTEAVRLQLSDGEEISPLAVENFLELVRHFTNHKTNEIDVQKVPNFDGVRFSHDREASILEGLINAGTRRIFWETLLLLTLQTILRDAPLELSPAQLHAIIHQERPSELGPSPLTLVLSVVRRALQHAPSKKLDASTLEAIEKTYESGTSFIDQYLKEADHITQGSSPLPPLAKLPYARAIRAHYEALDALNLALEAAEWLDRRHSIGKAGKEKLYAVVEKSRATIVALAREAAGEVVANTTTYAGIVAEGKVGEAVVALVGEDRVSAEMQIHCESVAESLQGLISGAIV